jgi:hypothetical protein
MQDVMRNADISKIVEMHEDASDFDRFASKSDWYFIFATRLKLWSIYRTIYMQTCARLIPLQLKNGF